jgi:hypothetical protein
MAPSKLAVFIYLKLCFIPLAFDIVQATSQSSSEPMQNSHADNFIILKTSSFFDISIIWAVLHLSLTACANHTAVVVGGKYQAFRTVSHCVVGSFPSENLMLTCVSF